MSDETKPGTYTCAYCGGTFESDRSDEEARAEHERIWGKRPGEDDVLVCEDCYKAVTAGVM